jgi:hypothetical protein
MEYFNSGAKMAKVEKGISQIESQLSYVQDSLRNIQVQLQRR